MITTQTLMDFERLWARRGTFHVDLSYGQALAQYTLCNKDDPDYLFLVTAKYQPVSVWIQEKINANSKDQAQATDHSGNQAAHKSSH